MASQTPFARLVGTWVFYTATASTAIPAIDAAPPGAWRRLGVTDGDQTIQYAGALEMLSDNETNGRRKHIRPEADFMVTATLVGLTLEDIAIAIGMNTSDVVTTTSGAANVKVLPNKRRFIADRFALLARGGAVEPTNTMSGYGNFPGQLWIPFGVFDGEPELTFTKDGSPGVEFTFTAEIDDSQPAGDEYGQFMMQIS